MIEVLKLQEIEPEFDVYDLRAHTDGSGVSYNC